MKEDFSMWVGISCGALWVTLEHTTFTEHNPWICHTSAIFREAIIANKVKIVSFHSKHPSKSFEIER